MTIHSTYGVIIPRKVLLIALLSKNLKFITKQKDGYIRVNSKNIERLVMEFMFIKMVQYTKEIG